MIISRGRTSRLFLAAVLAGFLAFPATSHAQTMGWINNNQLLASFQQVMYLGQMSQTDPTALAAYNTAVQNFEALLAQAQMQQTASLGQGPGGYGLGSRFGAPGQVAPF